MAETLNQGDLVVTSKLTYKFGDVERGDIIFFKKGKSHLINRIVGLPGEKIDYVDNELFINGVVYEEGYVEANSTISSFLFSNICADELCPNNEIPDDYYLVLGDHREDTKDSRDKEIGLVHKNEILGKVILRIWPVDSLKKF